MSERVLWFACRSCTIARASCSRPPRLSVPYASYDTGSRLQQVCHHQVSLGHVALLGRGQAHT
jgi:hypothetical protein